MRSTLVLSAVLILTAACGSVPKRNGVPPELGPEAEIKGIPYARYWGDRAPNSLPIVRAMTPEALKDLYPALHGRDHHYLAVSGGGANGAFGAGLLNGWTASGTRPEFTIVTGVSTGALIAPFAFLGPEYDAVLKKFYTTISTEDLIVLRSLLRGLTSDAMADVEPLEKLIAEVYDEEVIDRIAVEHRRGRRLLVGTVNLDAARPVVWNMGEIAASDAPNRVELFHSVLLASASIPGAFPPVFIPVVAGGKEYDEVHVDGGTCQQVFLFPVGVNWAEIQRQLSVTNRPRVWVIRNSRLDPVWELLTPDIMSLVGRTIESLIRTQGIGDLYRIWIDAKDHGMDFRLAFIPDSFTRKETEPFDKEYMVELFGVAYELALNGFPWRDAPPGEETTKGDGAGDPE